MTDFSKIYNDYYKRSFAFVKSYVFEDMATEDIVSESLVAPMEGDARAGRGASAVAPPHHSKEQFAELPEDAGTTSGCDGIHADIHGARCELPHQQFVRLRPQRSLLHRDKRYHRAHALYPLAPDARDFRDEPLREPPREGDSRELPSYR
jgi:hypothetical protein